MYCSQIVFDLQLRFVKGRYVKRKITEIYSIYIFSVVDLWKRSQLRQEFYVMFIQMCERPLSRNLWILLLLFY